MAVSSSSYFAIWFILSVLVFCTLSIDFLFFCNMAVNFVLTELALGVDSSGDFLTSTYFLLALWSLLLRLSTSLDRFSCEIIRGYCWFSTCLSRSLMCLWSWFCRSISLILFYDWVWLPLKTAIVSSVSARDFSNLCFAADIPVALMDLFLSSLFPLLRASSKFLCLTFEIGG